MSNPRDLLCQLLGYIEEQAKETDPRAYRVASSKGFVRWPSDFAGLPGVELDVNVEGDHIWLRVPRLASSKPKLPEDRFKPFITVSTDPEGAAPRINEASFLAWLESAAKEKTAEERAQLQHRGRAALDRFLIEYSKTWELWAISERPRRRTISLYGDLFALKQQLESEETSKAQELVWGVGVSVWTLSHEGRSFEFQYPLLTQAVEIGLDDGTMAIEIRPRAADTRIELGAMATCGVLGVADVERTAREQLQRASDRPVSPFDPGSYADILKLIAAGLDSNGTYRELLADGKAPPGATTEFIVTDIWTLFARPRSNSFLFDDLRRLRQRLDEDCEIPAGPMSIVTPPSDVAPDFDAVQFRGISSRGSGTSSEGVRELYFPLPYNEEQQTIVQRLESAPGVCVQGPPGTGKTHTIANIICHYLATGRRVLVTSRGEPALQVLQQKIPEEVRPLTVALLASDREGVRQFQSSIEAIQHRVSQIDPVGIKREIDICHEAVGRAHKELAEIDRRVDEIAIGQLQEIAVDGSVMRAQKLAELVVSGAEEHGWFDDSLSLDAANSPPLSEEDTRRLRDARRRLANDLIYVGARTPAPDTLPGVEAVAHLHEVLAKMKAIDGEIADGVLLELNGATATIVDSARELLSLLDEAIPLSDEIHAFEDGWPSALRLKCRESSFASERKALEALLSELDALVQSRAELLKRPVEFPEAAFAHPAALKAIEKGAETGKPFGLLAFGAGEAKQLVGSIKVAGLPPTGQDDWNHVSKYVLLHAQLISFSARWNQLSELLAIPALPSGISSIRRVEQVAGAARKAHKLAVRYDSVLVRKVEAVFENPPKKEVIGSPKDMKAVRDQISRHLTRQELTKAATDLAILQEKLAGTSGPASEAIRVFIDRELGSPTIAPERAAAKYAELVAEVRRIANLGTELAVVRDLTNLLEVAGAPKFAARLRTIPVASSGEDIAFPVRWRAAWTWARVRSHLEANESRAELVTLSNRRGELERGLGRLYRDMVGKAAWLSTRKSATAKVLQALHGYGVAIRRIGQGTGPNAIRYRRDARNAMTEAAGAVPCWIMSHARVSESIPPDIGAFDLVIVDEASQSDLWALPSILRGKRILVVGDHKQVSPDAGFISAQRIQSLRDRFLADQPYGVEMTPEKSLYDLAGRVFAAEQVMLREHFRCVPPIITYSNQTFYDDQIQPIRIPKASERIDPPLVDIFVPAGHRNAHDRNEQEAEAIAAEIEAILANKALVGRTIGVVSLLGMEQAKYIDSVVRTRFDNTELVHRRFACGDARTFQGSERDIMFLSMVVDRENCKALSGNTFEQRFNVAASRARDRMYLVRSVQSRDLSEKDLRLTLLSYFNRPMVVDNDDADGLIELCESGFERDVYSMLVAKGYRVIPQVKMGQYRIDMVVEGADDARLALECDGDEFHGPDRWQQDMLRQRVLERAGWTFWRCFASTWTLRKEEVFAELCAKLKGLGIEPMGALERAPALVEQRIWSSPQANDSAADEVQQVLEAAIDKAP